ncbi:hypothetical protein HDIA_1549 [Hartmannibacter diazotrophicus]|uniref:Uncharacterized protein n=1 Tax=Hartmannibacter diazotrophicus TaxID=1482074 RepID=A0A2C9D4F4_9HYPH|nr:hypothetical protein [Hartmannibacter diazotrophicus]SON55090.1 hypothetical protein HDIA_1549 [Hartmannibacter diazotrophicus]
MALTEVDTFKDLEALRRTSESAEVTLRALGDHAAELNAAPSLAKMSGLARGVEHTVLLVCLSFIFLCI